MTPDGTVCAVALLVTLASGFLFDCPGAPDTSHRPLRGRQGGNDRLRRAADRRPLLLVVQIAICAVLVTSSLVAVRGLLRSQTVSLGFDRDRAMLVDTDLSVAG
jgi:hypothetical protein